VLLLGELRLFSLPNYHYIDKFGCKGTKKIENRHLFERKIVLLQTITISMNYSNHPATKEYRQILRKTETPTEKILWRRLRGKQLDGLRFRQQHGFGPYVRDFYCPSLRLCIELDGEIHEETKVRLKDEERTAFLHEQRIHVLRFRNEDVESDVEGVLKRIREYIKRVIINNKEAVQTPVAP